MSHLIQFHSHPFRFLLYLEWILLTIVALIEAMPAPFYHLPRLPLLTVLMIAGFGVIGLNLPTGRQIYKMVYTGLEIGLIVLTTILGGIRIFPFLYLILVIRSCLIFKLPGRLIITGLAFILFLLTLRYRMQNLALPALPGLQERLWLILLSFALLFGLSLVFVLMLMNVMLAERQIRENLAIAHDQLRQYALRIEDQAMLQERNRIARDIHDSLGHALTALNLQLEGALKLWPSNPTKAQAFLTEAKRLGSTALHEVRQSVSALHADSLQGRTIEAAIAALTQEFHRSTDVLPDCRIQLSRPLPVEARLAVYRIVQEALTNICKYAAATAVKIQLQTTTATLYLNIQDNGKGFQVAQNTTGFGLQGMRERTLALGGRFKIESEPGTGCQIKAEFPLPRLTS